MDQNACDKIVSPSKRAAANRRNGHLFTGPRTEKGKSWSGANAKAVADCLNSMRSSKDRDGLADAPETPQELYAKCEANARVADRKTYERAPSILAGVLTFHDDLFVPESTRDTTPFTGDSGKVRLPRIIQQASRYRDVLQLLRDYPGREQRWLLLSLWLKREGICDPIEFLPAQIYENLTAKKRAKLRISIADVQHYCRVEAWKPYFERLLKDRLQQNGREPERGLQIAGYESSAIEAARNKRLAIPAVCEWLANILHTDSSTIRNAHCRISRRRTSRTS